MSFFMENMKGKHAVEEPAVGGFGHFLATAPVDEILRRTCEKVFSLGSCQHL